MRLYDQRRKYSELAYRYLIATTICNTKGLIESEPKQEATEQPWALRNGATRCAPSARLRHPELLARQQSPHLSRGTSPADSVREHVLWTRSRDT